MLALLPLAAAVAAGGGFWAMLSRMGSGSFDPHDIHAPALNRPVPAFALPDLGVSGPDAKPGFSAADLRAIDRPVLVNFFASWCIPCVEEAALLSDLSRQVPVWGIAYKNRPRDAAGFVSQTDAPYQRLGADRDGLVAIDWGVSGVPESFLVRPGGVIVWHLAGGLTRDAVERVLPALARRFGA